MSWLFAPLTRWLALGGLVLAAIGAAGAAGYVKGREAGRVDQLEAAVEAYKDRQEIDDETSALDDYAVCIDLGGLPGDCERLRRVDAAAEDQ